MPIHVISVWCALLLHVVNLIHIIEGYFFNIWLILFGCLQNDNCIMHFRPRPSWLEYCFYRTHLRKTT